MLIKLNNGQTLEQPVDGLLHGLRVDTFELDKVDILTLLSLDDEQLRERLNRMATRYAI